MFKAKLFGKKTSENLPENFDRDSFSDYQSFLAQHPNKTSNTVKTRPKGYTSPDHSQ